MVGRVGIILASALICNGPQALVMPADGGSAAVCKCVDAACHDMRCDDGGLMGVIK